MTDRGAHPEILATLHEIGASDRLAAYRHTAAAVQQHRSKEQEHVPTGSCRTAAPHEEAQTCGIARSNRQDTLRAWNAFDNTHHLYNKIDERSSKTKSEPGGQELEDHTVALGRDDMFLMPFLLFLFLCCDIQKDQWGLAAGHKSKERGTASRHKL